MIETKTYMRRSDFLSWKGVNKETVAHYIKHLQGTLKELKGKNIWTIQKLTKQISDKTLDDIKNIIEEEIRRCKFYFEFLKRQEKEKNFNEWFFVKKEDRKEYFNHPDWYGNKGDCWTKTNGKIRALININRTSGIRVRVSLDIMNDAKNLKFCEHNYRKGKEIEYKHLSNEDSIKKQIEKYKKQTEEFCEKYKYPIYCSEIREIELLNNLLHIGE